MRRKELDGQIWMNVISQEYWEEKLSGFDIEDPEGYEYYKQQNPTTRIFIKQIDRENKWFK